VFSKEEVVYMKYNGTSRFPIIPALTGPDSLAIVMIFLTIFSLAIVPIRGSGQGRDQTYKQLDWSEITRIGYTYLRQDGNRFVRGRGSMPDVASLDIELGGIPDWVTGVPSGESYIWAVVMKDGRVEGYRIDEGEEVKEVSIVPERIPSETPPLLALIEGKPVIITPPNKSASLLSHPVVLESSGRIAFIGEGGDLVIRGEKGDTRLTVDALLDARILVDESDRLLLLTDPTDSYGHGVLGDELEAGSVSLVETTGEPSLVSKISVSSGNVIEGAAPIWVDLTGDGTKEIIVTVSNPERGAKIMVYDESGEVVGAGPAIGLGFRWRHQLAIAPFGPEGEMELVDVLTPHIGGKVEYYRLKGDSLEIVASRDGFRSHEMGSRNLDMAAAGDFDGDGRPELLLPAEDLSQLVGVRRSVSGAEVYWKVGIGGVMTTNLAAVTSPSGEIAVAAGSEAGILRVWLPGG
jgi:hypothetical protein